MCLVKDSIVQSNVPWIIKSQIPSISILCPNVARIVPQDPDKDLPGCLSGGEYSEEPICRSSHQIFVPVQDGI
jgi:hypothetical protein